MEYNSADFDTTAFNQLEGVTIDPMVARIFDKAREIEEMVNCAGDTTAEERQALIAELDAMWPFGEMVLPVSGMATFPDPETDEIKTQYYDETPMISHGFVFTSLNQVALYFLKYTDASEQVGQTGTALLDEVTIDYPVHSIEMVENRLRYFNAELMQQLDSIVLNCNIEEEVVMALQDFALDIDMSQPEDRQLLLDLQNYLTAVSGFDSELPYRVQIAGDCYQYDEGDLKSAHADDGLQGLIGIHGIQFVPADGSLSGETTKKVVLGLSTEFFSADKAASSINLIIPAKSVQQISSLRREVYG